MIKKLLLLGLLLGILSSAGIAFAATPTISALSSAYKTYLTPPPPRIIKIADLIAAYKIYLAEKPATPVAPTTAPVQ